MIKTIDKVIYKAKKLNIGSGKDIKSDFINLDIIKIPGVDIVHDLNKFPWPFKDNYFEFVNMVSVLEHLKDPVKVLEEINRICKKDAIVEVIVPHFASLGAFVDPTHNKFFSYYSFDYFTKDFDYNFYTRVRFEIVERKIIYPKGMKLFEKIANKFPKLHEVFLRKFLTPKDIFFKLKVKKD